MYNIRMRLTAFSVAAASTALAIGLILLLESSPTSAFRLSEEGKSDMQTSSINSNNNKIINEINSRDKGPVVGVPNPLSSISSSASSRSSSNNKNVVAISKRSLSSSSSSSHSSDPTSFRNHRHENSILNVAWPPGGMWGFLPSNKKIAAAPSSLPSSSLHSQSSSSASSFNKKASSSLLSSSSDSASSLLAKKKSASSDLFLDPVTLDEGPSFFSGRHHPSSRSSISGSAAAPNSFFHSASSSLSSGSAPSGSSSGGGTSVSSGGADAKIHPTPPPRSQYMFLQPPTRIEAPIGDDVGAGGQSEDNEDLLENEILEGDGEHSNWLKRSYTSGIVTGSSAGYNKRKRDYDVPQIECPPADDGMERFACPSADHIGRYHCVDDHVLCDGFIDCPGKEDEDMQACMFYKTTKAHLDVLADALLRWARGKR